MSPTNRVWRSATSTAVLVRLGEVLNRTFVVPLVIFYPTSRCNSRCVSCDWWKCSGAGDLSLAEIDEIARAMPSLGTRLVVFSGGEPLLRPEVFDAARLFRARGVVLHLLTSGVLLDRCAGEVAGLFSRVIISLDAADKSLYQAVRGVAALPMVEKGVARLRRVAPDVPVTARATLHRLNFRELPRLIDHARAMALDGISFLPADLSSTAFGRAQPAGAASLGLTRAEVAEFADLVDATAESHEDAFTTRFVAESPAKLRRLPQYYAALIGDAAFPPVRCNAPYVSVVIEANGDVRPCFFHRAVGNTRHAPLGAIVDRNLPAFRRSLDVGHDPICARCVCSLRAGWRQVPWQ
jgi:MoaA/NifB/PqqE/SkfB family radical SAM enzyme